MATLTEEREREWAPLAIVNWWKLVGSTCDAEEETAKLLDSVQSLGFFYLDLRPPTDISGLAPRFQELKHLLPLVDELFEISKEFFRLDCATKCLFDVSTNQNYFGYKGVGKSYIDKAGTLDCNEFYNIAKDEILEQNSVQLSHPSVISDNRPQLKSFVEASSTIVTVLLQRISSSLNLDGYHDHDRLREPQEEEADALNARHRLGAASGDQISLIKYPSPTTNPNTQPLASHTDYGSLTLLFTSEKGLQLLTPLLPGADGDRDASAHAEWRFVRPLPGYAVVNCGDTLNILTGGRVRSNVHRVASQLDRRSSEAKYSIGYFCRPEYSVVLEPIGVGRREDDGDRAIGTTGTGMSSREWIMKRTYTRLVENYRGEDAWIDTLGTDEERLVEMR